MKMSSQMVERTLSQFQAEAVPETHQAVTQPIGCLASTPSSSMAPDCTLSNRQSPGMARRNRVWW